MSYFFVSKVKNYRTFFRNSFLADRVRVLKIWPGALGHAIHTITASKKPLQIQRHKPDASDPHTRPPGSKFAREQSIEKATDPNRHFPVCSPPG